MSPDKAAGESLLCSSRVSFADAKGVTENTGYVESLMRVKEKSGILRNATRTERTLAQRRDAK